MNARLIFAAIVISPLLGGCFFIYLPGSVVGGISDTLTGSFGNQCVGALVKVGDKVTGNGARGTVIRISGESVRCSSPTPIRAEVVFD